MLFKVNAYLLSHQFQIPDPVSDIMSSQNAKFMVPCTFCPKSYAQSYIKKHMKTHTKELKEKEIENAGNPSEEEIEENNLEDQIDNAELYYASEVLSQQDEIISGVLGDILDGAIRAKKTQIDPSPSWFMSTMSGWEGMLIAATEEAEGVNDINQVETDLTESDRYTCGECDKKRNPERREEMKEHPN